MSALKPPEVARRVLPEEPIDDLDAYVAAGGGAGLRAARAAEPEAVIAEIEASGLRGRGGAGFPTGRKWRTVVQNSSPLEPSSVVVNAAEGEPGSFKDRTILRANPYHVIEGALVAAHAIGANEVIVGLKRTFEPELARLRQAIDEIEAAGWADGVALKLFAGPSEYLYGEETALLETIDGRYPFPRIAPPFRRGVEEVVEHAEDLEADSSSSAHVEMAGPTSESIAPPTLAGNVETFANVAAIVARGAPWFRELGTDKSPGTIVVTISGATAHAGVVEVPMGTPLREVLDAAGGGVRSGHAIKAVMSGVSNALLPASKLDTPLTYEDMSNAGAGLGSAGFIVFDDATDPVAVAAGVSRFLAVESCGQCTPCKADGLVIADLLAHLSRSQATEDDLDTLTTRLDTVSTGARCNLAYQQQTVVQSVLDLFADDVAAHEARTAAAAEPVFIAAIVDIVDGAAVLDEHERAKQPDWTFDADYSGKYPADRLDEHRAPENL